MEGRFDFGHPQIVAYIMSNALQAYEKDLGNQNELNTKNIHQQLGCGKKYIQMRGRELLPKGIYQFRKEAHFHPAELKNVVPCCELVFLLSQPEEQDGELLPLLRTAVMDATRQYISQQMLPALYNTFVGRKLPCVSPFFGPGLFSTPLSEMKEYYSYLKVTSELATLKGHMLEPLFSFIGAIYGLEEVFPISTCITCMGQSNCRFCMMCHEL